MEIIFYLNYQQVHGDKKEELIAELGVSPRQLMQKLGTDLFREKLHQSIPELNLRGKTIWLWHLEKRIEMSSEDYIIVSDVRFPDEVDMIKELGGIIVKINNPNSSCVDTHISEMLDITEVDYIIENCGNLEYLKQQVHDLVSTLST